MTKNLLWRRLVAFSIPLFILSTGAHAQSSGYVELAGFEQALEDINASSEVFGLDDIGEQVIASGDTIDLFQFEYDFGEAKLAIVKVQDSASLATTSDGFFLGSTDADVLQDGDVLTFNFDQPLHGFGLYLTSADALEDGDVRLTAPGVSVELIAQMIEGVLEDGAAVYFLGLVNPQQSFSSAELSTGGSGVFLYTLDDLYVAAAADSDNDGAANAVDNCLGTANPGQVDADGDNIGNACDADIGQPNDCIVNVVDLGVLRQAFFGTPGTPNWNPHADFNSDGVVNVQDLGIMRARFFMPPGPSALPNACGGSR